MMKMRWALLIGLLVIVCVSMTTAEDPKSEPEPEPGDEDSKHNAGTAGKQTKDGSGKNPASVPWAFSVPAIITFVSVAKFIL